MFTKKSVSFKERSEMKIRGSSKSSHTIRRHPSIHNEYKVNSSSTFNSKSKSLKSKRDRMYLKQRLYY